MVNHLISQGYKIGYLDTELGEKKLLTRLTAISLDTTPERVEKDKSYKNWYEKYRNQFLYAGTRDLSSLNGIIDFDKTIAFAQDFKVRGAKVLFFDNLTTYFTQPTEKRLGWENLANCLTKVVNFTKLSGVISFIVIHTKQNICYVETPQGIRKLIKNNESHKIFNETITIVKKPTLADVFGGGASLSQLNGSMLIWRPYQKLDDTGFSAEKLQSSSAVILESFRDCQSGKLIRTKFDGKKMRFYELSSKELAEEIFKDEKVS